jgi:hypothetical protein
MHFLRPSFVLAAAVLVSALVFTTPVPAGATAATWTLDSGPSTVEAAGVIACADASYCVVAPGYPSNVTLVGSGSSWTTEALASGFQVNGLACTSETFCVAVGVSGLEGAIETWNGTSWSSAFSGDSWFSAVSCPSANACFAAGSSGNDGIVETWNGTSWSQAVSSANTGRLTGISCNWLRSCVAVSSSDSLVYDGWSWRTVGLEQPGQTTIQSVSCAAPNDCIAVGDVYFTTYGSALTLAEHWNGYAWSVMATPNLAPGTSPPVGVGAAGGNLASVSCTAWNACVAVGYGGGGVDADGLGYPAVAIVETWDGRAWSMTPNPAPIEPDGDPYGAPLRSVSCVSSWHDAICLAGGSQTNSSFVQSALLMGTSSAIGFLRPSTVSLVESAGTLNVTVTPAYGTGDPSGTVTILSDGAVIPSCPPVVLDASSEASCSAGSATGPFTVEYSGDATYDGAVWPIAGSGPPLLIGITLDSSGYRGPGEAIFGATVTCNEAVSGTASVAFTLDGATVDSSSPATCGSNGLGYVVFNVPGPWSSGPAGVTASFSADGSTATTTAVVNIS